ncbi:RNA recognition motif 2-domain-containing protein [Epithele typhae]|uniref:RNA recognition motif 2-domain-containing protein n=1 Tax=Epithele typhae TaxID=378194 RepID=UPI002007C7BE|nr:RNA recognition motif 2-domain-containing protein [Epithele typhae]KAH9942348.1 RNA recognition motif 2-domain-containing protein [Epithele typhae]
MPMDIHAIPFPTTHHVEDSQLADKRPSVPPRLHSTPSLPNLWLPHHYGSLVPPVLSPGTTRRPHLRPLDLASSPSTSPTTTESSDSSRRPPALLTPPLTPSSFTSHIQDTPSTLCDPLTPPRWAPAEHGLKKSPSTLAYPSGLATVMSAAKLENAHQMGYLTPTSARSHSHSSSDEDAVAAGDGQAYDITSLASGLAGVDITPRDERPLQADGYDAMSELDFGETSSEHPTRLLLVRNVPASAPTSALLEVFHGFGDVKGIQVRFQQSHGVAILAFYDTRHAGRAMRQISGKRISTLSDVCLTLAFMDPAQVQKFFGKSDFVSELDGAFRITVEGRSVVPHDVRTLFASFGELASFSGVGAHPHDQTFHVEYHDCRDAANARKALNNRMIFGARLAFAPNTLHGGLPSSPQQMGYPSSLDVNDQTGATDRTRPRSVSASDGSGGNDIARRTHGIDDGCQDHGRRSSNHLFFDAVGKAFEVSHVVPPRPRSISASADDLAGLPKMQAPPGYFNGPPIPYGYPDSPYVYGSPGPVPFHPHPFQYPVYGHDSTGYRSRDGETASNAYWTYTAPHLSQVDYLIPPGPRGPAYTSPCAPPTRPSPSVDTIFASPSSSPPRPVYGGRQPSTPQGNRTADLSQAGGRSPGAKNVLDIGAIENGTDTRTTVMIKNIPNKMTDKDLKAFIDKVCPRRIDFMYLRMDFQNGCNVGYAFVNFITVQDLLHFAKTQIGVKWNMYSSEKTLHMCYATYQGKESLVEKFKNSCIMDEKEAWRPKIYYSDGSNQGLHEPFPAPTHLRRKERSQHNRGALFVPGTHHHPSGGGGLYHHRPHPPRMTSRP